MDLPPLLADDVARLKAEIAFTPEEDREEAIQESWVAHCQGRDAVQAVATFRVRELRHHRRQRATFVTDTDASTAGIARRVAVNRLAAPRQSNSTRANNAA